MELEYKNGIRITKLHHEMSPLESAIHNYERMAKKHFSKLDGDPNLTKEEREVALEKSLVFLERERRHIDNIAVVQAQLETYREQGMKSTRGSGKENLDALNMMRNEAHHPTNVLEAYMRAEAVPKPSRHHTAHHILPGSGRWKKVDLARARTHIHKHGVRINDPANGVYLVATDDDAPHWTMPNSSGHKKYHTAEYEGWVAQRISQLTHIDFIKTQLQIIGRILQENEPKDAIHKIKNRQP